MNDVSIAALEQAYHAGLSPEEVLSKLLVRIARYPRQGIWIYSLNKAEIDSQLMALHQSRRAGMALPLYGIPFAVKDNIDVAGIPTTAACPAFSYTPATSATSVRKLMDAGAIVVGKTNLDQFATGLVGTRSPYGVCQNAYNPEYISGGSSSGSAVAVAGGLVSFSLGTDTAGSGRVPAAFNNIVGLKPTLGLVSASGVVPACRSIDCVSIFSGTCAEAELVLKVVAGTDPTDAFSRAASPTSAQVLPLESLRIGIPDQLNFFGNRDAESLFKAACDRVRKMGASIVTIDYAPFRRAGELLYDGPWVAERLLTPGNLLHENPEALRPEIRSILQSGSRYSATDAFRGWYQLAEFRRQAREHWTRMDALLVPTTGTIYRIKEIEADPIQLNRNLGLYTTFVNLLDLSALAVPAGLLPSGLPWGVTFIAPPFHEARLLELGAAFHNHVLSEGQS